MVASLLYWLLLISKVEEKWVWNSSLKYAYIILDGVDMYCYRPNIGMRIIITLRSFFTLFKLNKFLLRIEQILNSPIDSEF